MSWDTWGLGTKVIVSRKTHGKYRHVGTIQAHNPAQNEFSVRFEDGEVTSIPPEELVAFDAKDNTPKIDEPEEIEQIIEETAPETLLRLASRDEGVTLHQLCEERGSTVRGPYQRCINANIKKGLVIEKGNGVFFTTGSAMRESLKRKEAIPVSILGEKEYITKAELSKIFEQMSKMLR